MIYFIYNLEQANDISVFIPQFVDWNMVYIGYFTLYILWINFLVSSIGSKYI